MVRWGRGRLWFNERVQDPQNDALDEAVTLAARSLAARTAGDLAGALAAAERCLELRRESLGERHAETAAALGLVAAARRRRGELDAALAADRLALEIYEAVLGDSHADTATAAGNLSATHRARREHEAALALGLRALAGLRAACGDDDLQTALAWGNLAAARRARGEHAEAVACGRELVRIRRAVLGDMNLETAAARSTLGALLAAGGDLSGALVEEEAALQAREGDARATIESLVNIATIYRSHGDVERSLAFQRRALELQRTTLGEADPETTRSRVYVAYTLLRAGRRVEAERLIDEGLRHAPRNEELRKLKTQLEAVAMPGFRAPAARGKPRGRGKR
jgi:tetratricopeptide (TPR) repeat protein